ncbi:MAG: hypothetical protein ACTSVT_11670 [Candidatus Thorarchaeota archaeon]
MSSVVRSNKFLLTALVLSVVIGGMSFANLPPTLPATGIQTINGVTFDFFDYGLADHEVLAFFNYLYTLVSSEYQGYGEWDGWNFREELHGLAHCVLVFMTYATSTLFETTPGYRTDYYRSFAYDLIKRMNTTEDEWGTNSVEYWE